ncbi:MAG: hypothetical protein IJS31_06445 [Oscillospiraceae bacterium]|nr:hypothetical protein [Oscillospiraceae bacterium]
MENGKFDFCGVFEVTYFSFSTVNFQLLSIRRHEGMPPYGVVGEIDNGKLFLLHGIGFWVRFIFHFPLSIFNWFPPLSAAPTSPPQGAIYVMQGKSRHLPRRGRYM